MNARTWPTRLFSTRALVALPAVVFALLVAGGAWAQTLYLSASPNPAAIYQKVTLSVIVPADSTTAVSADLPERSGRIHIVSGPYVQPYVDSENPQVPKVEVSYVIEGNEPGRVVIPPVAVTVGSTVLRTSPAVMAFGVLRKGKIVVPLQPAWSLPTERQGIPFYTGESIPVVLELRNELEEANADTVQISKAPPELVQVSDFAQPSKRTVGQTTLYQLPVASYILTASGTGALTLPAAVVTAGERSGAAIPKEIRIAPLPDAISKSAAIGALAFRSWVTKQRVQEGEEISLHLRVEGTGNLPRIVMPVPAAKGLLEIDKSENKSIRAGDGGYSGFREIVYRYLLQPSSAGGNRPSAVTVPRFAWLDPGNGGIEAVPERTFTVAAPDQKSSIGAATGGAAATSNNSGVAGASRGTVAANRPEAASLPYSMESAAKVRSSEYRELYKRSDSYLWLVPGPVVFGLFLIVRPRRRRGGGGFAALVLFGLLVSCRLAPLHDSVAAGVAAYDAGRFVEAADDFAKAESAYPRNAALSFDRGLVEYRLGRYGEAVHSLRTAIYYDPLSATYRSALDWMVAQIGVPEQVPPAYPIHPDLFLIVLIVAVNAASVLGILVLIRRTGALAIALILLLVVSVISAGGLGYTAVKRAVKTAVVRSSGTEMTKIPMPVAGRWLELPAGMAVRIRDSADGYYLVQTAYGNTGWVRKDRVLVDGKELQKR